MPQLSIKGFTRPVQIAAGQKRSAEDDEYDSDEIKVGASQHRQPLNNIAPQHVQNKRPRVLDCVLIPVGKVTTSPAETVCSSHGQTQRRYGSSAASPASAGNSRRTTRVSQLPRYDVSSEDELSTASAKPVGRKPSGRRSITVESDFEDDVESEAANDSSDGAVSDASQSTMSIDEVSDEDMDAPDVKKKAKVASRAASGGPVKTGVNAKNKSKGASSSKKMKDLISRGTATRGLDGSLPPIHDIQEIFRDIVTKALELGFRDVLQHFEGTPPRVATMCSGVESPMLALNEVCDALKKDHNLEFGVSHAFSAEIVASKQAYIDRNFNPPLIFRDITELINAKEDEVPMATTAYGAKAVVPTDIHILIAGTSCVDFSNLNKHKKTLTDDGESAKTWEGVFDFVRAYRPPIVIIENVKSAPWDRMYAEYERIGYEPAGVIIDAKNYYMPQTRQRGYMICFDQARVKQANVKYLEEKVHSLMEKFKRPASSPVSSFLQSSSQLCAKDENRADDARREVDWVACAESHVRYRQDMRLGNARPFTNWQESGSLVVPENGSPAWYHGQVERVYDLMDCSLLRKAREMYDVRYKTRIWDVSQNVYMNEDTAPFGIAGCITPGGQFFASDAGRALTPEENLILQGIPLDKISFTKETPKELQDLAGNAMTSTVVGSVILSALIAGHKIIDNIPKSCTPEAKRRTASMASMKGQVVRTLSKDTNVSNASVPDLLETARRSLRRCFCEGGGSITKRELQECVDCGHTTCVQCGGNPQHNYKPNQALSKGRLSPQEAEAKIRSQLPLQMAFTPASKLINDLKSKLRSAKGLEKYPSLVESAVNDSFSIQKFRRAHCISVTYGSASGNSRLELSLNDGPPEWRLYVEPPKHLAVSDPLRLALKQPVAISTITDSLLSHAWSLRVSACLRISATINGHGGDVPTWWARNEMPDFRAHKQPQYLSVKINEDSRLGTSLDGEYKYLPHCGTACDSLYKRVDNRSTRDAMFLFLDPTRVGDPKDDYFVFSRDTHRLDYDESRPVEAMVASNWRPWERNHGETSIELDSEWIAAPDVVLQPSSTALEVYQPEDYNHACQIVDCRQSVELISCRVESEEALNPTQAVKIRNEDIRFFKQNAWLFETMRRHTDPHKWHSLMVSDVDNSCHHCAPAKPNLRWKLSDDGDSIEPYEDQSSAATYERLIKSRPAALEVEAIQNATSSSPKVRLGANLISMAHRARARLPHHIVNVSFTWRLRTDFNPSSSFSFSPFKLKPITGIEPFAGDTKMDVDLFPNQKRSLAWMLQQEAGDGRQFSIEESDEEKLTKLGWSLEMRASASVHVRGGICADHPGYGKTILSLALIKSDPDFNELLNELKGRQTRTNSSGGLITSTATLVICPRTLVDQWAEEAQEKGKLRIGTDVLAIKTPAELDKKTIDQLAQAKLVVVSSTILSSEQYAERLAALAAVPGPAATKGRAFEKWLEYASKEIPEHLKVLQDHGRAELKQHAKKKYSTNVNSDEFKAFTPSRRLRGEAFAAAQKTKTKAAITKLAAPSSLDTTTVGSPQLGMFFWNRIICDEFHQFETRELAIIKSLKKDKIWGLSGTPAIGDFYDVAKNAELLGVPLRIGSDARGIMKQKNIRDLRKEMTAFERFDSMRQVPSESTHARIHEQHQHFLDTFVTRNVADFKIDFETHLVPVSLDLDHRAVYTEMSQHLNSIEMRLKKGSRSKTTDREQRLYDAVGCSETAEEALSKTAAYFEREINEIGLQALIRRREVEVAEFSKNVRAAIKQAEKGEPIGFERWRQGRAYIEALGDQETLDTVLGACSNNNKTREAIAATKTKNGEKESRSQGLVSNANALITRLLSSMRSLRFVRNVARVQDSSRQSKAEHMCSSADCQSEDRDLGVSAFCGHVVCQTCCTQMRDNVDTQCPAHGCYAPIKDHHILWKSRMGDLSKTETTPYGAKIEAATNLLKNIRDQGDQAILFVQYENQLREVAEALDHYGIAATVADSKKTTSQKVENFKSADTKLTAIVLNASDETATGLNLQNANHVIFMSPLLRDQQYSYEATMAQAIGRVRRHGQKKQIHVYRIVALDTIDVDILEHRERRTNAIVEYGAPAIIPPSPLSQGQIDPSAEPVTERTQLVREDGRFSLRPRSWLYCSGADTDEAELEKVRGSPAAARNVKVANDQRIKAKGRIMGWEDFSSLIKFSRAYTEDDE